jgi:hypothetical protein
MTQPGRPIDPGNLSEAKLPRRDWVVLPALSLLTICLIVVATDLLGRLMFANSYGAGEDCLVLNDPSTGARGIPNSVCREKIPEGEATEYRFNGCGYRTDIECGSKRPGAYRIVMIGGSYAMGMRVPIEKTFATLLPAELSRRTGRSIELYNEGMPWKPPHVVALHFDQVLAARPDMIFWVFVPSDTWNAMLPRGNPESPQVAPSAPSKVKQVLEAAYRPLRVELSSHSGILFRHFLYESQSQTITSYLAERPDEPFMRKIHGPEFLKVEPSAELQGHLAELDGDIAEIEGQARAAGVPLVAVLLPERAQAAMISKGEWPAGFDPYKLDNELRSMIVRHGGTYVDILPDLRNIPNSEQGFFTVEGHPNAYGHAMISAKLGEELTNGEVPALSVVPPQKAEMGQGR